MKQKLQQFNEVDKYDEMMGYLNENDMYWLENDKWNMNEKYNYHGMNRNLNFNKFSDSRIKTELKYAIVYSLENKYLSMKKVLNIVSSMLSKLSKYLDWISNNTTTLREVNISTFRIYLLNIEQLKEITVKEYIGAFNSILSVINNLFDDIDEIEKDVWNCLKIQGTRTSATCSRKGYTINFLEYPQYYRNCMKRYFRTIITKKSLSQCLNIHVSLVSFFDNFAELGYGAGFLRNLSREDIEKYIVHINGKYQGKNGTYINRLLSYPRTFLEYIQIANYEEAPTKEISFLIFQDDMPKREKYSDTLKKVKFVPEPILQQLDGSIMELDRPELIPIYVLLRETGWRGTDILNLRYDNCLEKIWNCKENKYNNYLCGEITKTGIPNLKIPIRDTVAEMI